MSSASKRYTPTCETMLDREAIDGVMVATHHAAHYPVAKACLERGRHVFIEKPMTLRAKHARALVELGVFKAAANRDGLQQQSQRVGDPRA